MNANKLRLEEQFFLYHEHDKQSSVFMQKKVRTVEFWNKFF